MDSALVPVVEPVGRGCLLRAGGLNLYFDPEGVLSADAALPKADIVCLTGEDPRALAFRSVKAVAMMQTIIVGAPPCVAPFVMNQAPILPGQPRDVLGFRFSFERPDGGPLRVTVEGPRFRFHYPERRLEQV